MHYFSGKGCSEFLENMHYCIGILKMRLTAMADAFRNQLDDPKCREIPFEDQFGMLVDIEYSSRVSAK